MTRVVVTGSEGLIGKEVSAFLSKNHEVLRLDLVLGHDLEDEEFVKKWFDDNPSDYLVNAFGLNDHVTSGRSNETLFDISLESFDEYMSINLRALFSVCREFARKSKGGGIVNFSATTGVVSARPDFYDGGHKHIGYCVSKAGVVQLSRYLAVHLAPDIRVNCLIPGGAQHEQSIEFLEKYSRHTPMKRMMRPQEINGIVDFLCSTGSSYMTGAEILIDGGWTAW